MDLDFRTQAAAAAAQFAIDGVFDKVEPLRVGHIHHTFVSTWQQADGVRRYLHQRINDTVFEDVRGLMHNIEKVTAVLGETQHKGDLEVLSLVLTRSGRPYLNHDGGLWRTFDYVENTDTFNLCRDPKQAYQAAHAFGSFQVSLIDLNPDDLVEIIPGFFSPSARLWQLEGAFRRNLAKRADSVRKDFEFIQDRRHEVASFDDAQRSGALPNRVVHGDTKLNNILFDKASGLPRCVVDLDTCMSGWSLYDFGDLVRFTAAKSREDAPDPDLAGIDLKVYTGLYNGWIDSLGTHMQHAERALMPFAARMVTMIIGMRFLADHLNGDVYFHVQHEGQNLHRARNQFAMLRDMEEHADRMAPPTTGV